MKICIFGTGAIGGYLAAKLAGTGVELTCIARGDRLQAMRERGLRLIENGKSQTIEVECTDRPDQPGPQDAVFVTLKSHTVPGAAQGIAELLGPDTMVVSAGNGIPWWYFHGLPVDDPPELTSVDPGRVLWQTIGPERAIGAVVYPAARLVEPGVVEHVFGNRFALGEPDGTDSERVRSLAEMLAAAGLEASVEPSIRTGIWTKLVANAAYNPVSLLTGKSLGAMIDDDATRRMLTRIIDEATAVAAALDVSVPVSADDLLEATRQLGGHKTSMLQDLEAGRQVELDPIVGAVQELGRLQGVATPTVDTVLALAKQKAALSGCYS